MYVIGVVYFGSHGMFVFVQAEDGIRDLVRSRGLGDVYKRQINNPPDRTRKGTCYYLRIFVEDRYSPCNLDRPSSCLLYTSDAADERSSVDLGGRRIIKKKNTIRHTKHRT